jgi:hypothetical protein
MEDVANADAVAALTLPPRRLERTLGAERQTLHGHKGRLQREKDPPKHQYVDMTVHERRGQVVPIKGRSAARAHHVSHHWGIEKGSQGADHVHEPRQAMADRYLPKLSLPPSRRWPRGKGAS